jgi:DNA-binding MarR family transcriptional regulator
MPRAKKAPTTAAPDVAVAVAPDTTKAPITKSATVLACLQREHGATLAELVAATGWQPHTTRAMLTGLRKKGHAIERRKRDDVSCYHLPVADA